MSDGFLDWFAGFFAGEGTFFIKPYQRCRSFAIGAAVVVRADDAPILDELRARTGIGRRYSRTYKTSSKPQAAWEIFTAADRVRLIAIFDEHPLRAKKARDYDIWRAAHQAHARRDYASVAALRSALIEGRQFEAPLQDIPDHPQLALVAG